LDALYIITLFTLYTTYYIAINGWLLDTVHHTAVFHDLPFEVLKVN